MIIERAIKKRIKERLFQGKAILLLGARQTGKTTLVRSIIESTPQGGLYLNCDEPDIRQRLAQATSTALGFVIGNQRLIVIDEAQRVANIGLTLKLLVDNFPDRQVIATGSSALDLANAINEPLTGRKYEFQLHPLSQAERVNHYGTLETDRMLEQAILYGQYPEVVTKHDQARELLLNLTNSYLYKDILEWQKIRKPELLQNLLKALALQIGQEVSYNELAVMFQVSKDTVAQYLQMLEKVFVIFRLGSFSRNLRNELSRKQKYYFWDTGVRNALLNNFTPLALRGDLGGLWENFLLAERFKRNAQTMHSCNVYFWRTTQQQEIDYVEEYDGKLHAYEFKWNPGKKVRFTKTFLNAYPDSKTAAITRDNYLDFVTR